ncbi:hypothetical protein DFH06DRAFT_1159435 [Mycena polygramma]|nr:hypothetical protein DFH06DRAFT_1159435 [Mycena polygramma]
MRHGGDERYAQRWCYGGIRCGDRRQRRTGVFSTVLRVVEGTMARYHAMDLGMRAPSYSARPSFILFPPSAVPLPLPLLALPLVPPSLPPISSPLFLLSHPLPVYTLALYLDITFSSLSPRPSPLSALLPPPHPLLLYPHPTSSIFTSLPVVAVPSASIPRLLLYPSLPPDFPSPLSPSSVVLPSFPPCLLRPYPTPSLLLLLAPSSSTPSVLFLPSFLFFFHPSPYLLPSPCPSFPSFLPPLPFPPAP